MLTAKFGFPLSKALRQPGDKTGGVTGKKEQRHDIPQPKSLEYSVHRISCRFYKSGGGFYFSIEIRRTSLPSISLMMNWPSS